MNHSNPKQLMHTIVPVGTFERKAIDLIGADGYDDLVWHVANNLTQGSLIQGAGGLRKTRFAVPGSGKGKSGGARVIYYYHSPGKPTLLLLIYTKANQDNLTDAQKAELKKLVDEIVDGFR